MSEKLTRFLDYISEARQTVFKFGGVAIKTTEDSGVYTVNKDEAHRFLKGTEAGKFKGDVADLKKAQKTPPKFITMVINRKKTHAVIDTPDGTFTIEQK